VIVGRRGRPVTFSPLAIFGACREVVSPVALRVLRPSDGGLDVDSERVRNDRRRQVGRELYERAVVRSSGMDSRFVEVPPQGGHAEWAAWGGTAKQPGVILAGPPDQRSAAPLIE